jgi:hypothetical protein
VPVGRHESAFAVSRNAKAVAGREIAGLLGTFATERWPVPRPIDVTAGRYHGFPGRGDARRLRRAGRPLL